MKASITLDAQEGRASLAN